MSQTGNRDVNVEKSSLTLDSTTKPASEIRKIERRFAFFQGLSVRIFGDKTSLSKIVIKSVGW